jgi:mannose-6-phosphate isomerase
VPAITSAYFNLELARASATDPLIGDTAGRTFHILTAIEGTAEVTCHSEVTRLGRFDAGVVAAAAGHYEVRAIGGPVTLLRASVPGS